ncbi:UNKNOWN [Stylonychia lemnae]|uniref:Uncharacterized protein n=1 Tax=Stylonychia lemnae TaxID=5949 RepID=A0A078B2F5_STYLE|nr:UNKNOWN [Stylonychia lemnae]|eukprot:CDW87663.1 UNKNOWN [Stylonychia lemnae]
MQPISDGVKYPPQYSTFGNQNSNNDLNEIQYTGRQYHEQAYDFEISKEQSEVQNIPHNNLQMTLTERLKKLDTDEMRSSGIVLSKNYNESMKSSSLKLQKNDSLRLSATFKGSINENADEDQVLNSPRIHKQMSNGNQENRSSVNTSQRGPYYNPIRTSQDHTARMSINVKERDSVDIKDAINELKQQEQLYQLAEQAKHSYFKKPKSKFSDTILATENPFEINKNKTKIEVEDVIPSLSQQSIQKKRLNEANLRTLKGNQQFIPQTPSLKDVELMSITSKADSVKQTQMNSDAKSSYLDVIKEESDSRRSRFYNQSISNIYNNGSSNLSQDNKSVILDFNQPNFDKQTVKSDQTNNASKQQKSTSNALSKRLLEYELILKSTRKYSSLRGENEAAIKPKNANKTSFSLIKRRAKAALLQSENFISNISYKLAAVELTSNDKQQQSLNLLEQCSTTY